MDDLAILEYISDVASLCIKTCSYTAFLHALDSSKLEFDDERKNDLVKIKRLQFEYFKGNFDSAFSELERDFNFEYIRSLDPADPIANHIASSALNIFLMEGFLLDTARLLPKHGSFFGGYADMMFQLGEFDVDLILRAIPDFRTLDAKLAIDRLSVAELQQYINGLHRQQHLERIQSNYLHVKLCGKSFDDIEDMVTVNPYAVGMKNLIKAMTVNSADEANFYFQKAIEDLRHIKYYYVEAIVKYSEFLSDGDEEIRLQSVLDEGVSMAKYHGFRFLQYQLEKIGGLTDLVYSSEDYPLSSDIRDCIDGLAGIERDEW